jgi:prepilin-type N-terminal cleavage/methylation domain-containing protein
MKTTIQIRHRQSGLTILEVLVSIAVAAILMTATVQAIGIGLGYDSRFRAAGESDAAKKGFEDRIRELISRAYLNPVATDDGSFFIASQGALSGGESTDTPDTLTFTVIGDNIPSAVRTTADDSQSGSDAFEQLNEQYGPQGGVSEICLSPSAIGSAPETSGTFIRRQTPADSDPTQGGRESLLNADVTSLRFEFYDGTQWIGTWDTRQQATKRLPACVRLTYRWKNDDTDSTLVISLPSSDVTTDNPITEGEG